MSTPVKKVPIHLQVNNISLNVELLNRKYAVVCIQCFFIYRGKLLASFRAMFIIESVLFIECSKQAFDKKWENCQRYGDA